MTDTITQTRNSHVTPDAAGRRGRVVERICRSTRATATVFGKQIDAILGWMPLTPFGAIAIAALVITIRMNSALQVDLIIKSVGFGGLAICIADILTVLVAGIWIRFATVNRSSNEPLELETGIRSLTGFRLGLISWAPLLAFDVAWEEPLGIDAGLRDVGTGRSEEVLPRERGRSEVVVRRFTVRDWFGLARIRFRRRMDRSVRCLPFCGQASCFELIQQFRPGEILGHPKGAPHGDLVEMRRYAPGDAIKLVLWKAYARTGRMMVRTPELSVEPTDRMLAYLVAAKGDDPTAGIARSALQSGALGPDVIFMADGANEPSRTYLEALDQIVRSVAYRDSGGTGLDRFLTRTETAGASAAFLFVSSRPGPWLDQVCQCISTFPGPFRAVIGVDGIRKDSEFHRWRRMLMRPTREGMASARELRIVRDRLIGSGAQVLVINRQTGEATSLEEVTS